MRALWEQNTETVAVTNQPGAFYQDVRLVFIDGSTLDVPDTAENLAHFGRQESSCGQSAFPQLRFVALCESGSHTIFSVSMGSYATHELLDAEKHPAQELAALYPERWEVEVTLDEFKTHMRGGQVVLRSKAPKLVEQEFYGMMLAHRAVRCLMNEAALRQSLGPDRLSYSKITRPDQISSSQGCSCRRQKRRRRLGFESVVFRSTAGSARQGTPLLPGTMRARYRDRKPLHTASRSRRAA